MMARSNYLLLALLTLGLLTMSAAQAASITNGDFQTCDFRGWQKDTDGLGDPGATGDFAIAMDAGDCSAQIRVDDFATTTAFSANTLFTELDLSANPGDQLRLSFDWDFFGTDGDPWSGDFFQVGLGDGSGYLFDANGQIGTLLESPTTGMSSYGSGHFSAYLDDVFFNQPGWFLDFTVNEGFAFNPEPLASTLEIDNVALTQVSAELPETGGLLLMLTGLMGLAWVRKGGAQS